MNARFRVALKFFFALSVPLLLVACQGFVPSNPTGRAPVDEGEAAFDDQFKIGPGDVLQIRAWQDPNLTDQVTVLPDGRISFPLIGDMMAEGLSPEKLARKIEQKVHKFDATAKISVLVITVNSLEYSVIREVGGQVFPLTRRTTLLEAIAQAGGFEQFSDRGNVVLIRQVDGREKRYRFNFDDYVRNPRSSKSVNIEVRPGDVILIQ